MDSMILSTQMHDIVLSYLTQATHFPVHLYHLGVFGHPIAPF